MYWRFLAPVVLVLLATFPGRCIDIEQGPVHLMRSSGETNAYGDGATTNVQRGTALKTALLAAQSGDILLLGPGIFDIEASPIDLSKTNATEVTLHGSGRDITRIESDEILLPSNFIVVPGNNTVISNLSIAGTATGGVYQGPLGVQGGSKVAANVLVESVALSAESDCVHLLSVGFVSIRLVNCKLDSKYDCVQLLDTGTKIIDLVNCNLTATGSFDAEGSFPTRPIGGTRGTVRMFGGTIDALNGEDGDFGVQAVAAMNVELHGVTIKTASGGTDLATAGGGAISVDAATIYNANKTSGSLNRFNTYGKQPAQSLQASLSPTATLSPGEGQLYLSVPATLNGGTIVGVYAGVVTAGITGTTDVQIARIRGGSTVDVLSTELTIDSGETGSNLATIPAVINLANAGVQTFDRL